MYYLNNNLKDLVRIFDQNERKNYLRLDLNENPGGLPQDFIDSILPEITPQLIAQYPETRHFSDFAGQADRWRPELRERYAYDLRQCDYQTLVQEAYTPGCMMRRNRYMVDASRILIAAFDGRPGGTARTLEYAARRRLEIIQIPIDSAPADEI